MNKGVDDLLFTGVALHAICCLVRLTSAFEDNGEYDLPRFDLIDDIGVLQAGVPAMDVLDTLAEFQLRRENKYGHIDLEADAGFYAEVGGAELYQVLRFAGGGIGREVIPVVDPSHHIDPEIPDAVREEFYLCGKTQQQGLDLLGGQLLLALGRVVDMIGEAVAAEDELGEGKAKFQVIGKVKSEHSGYAKATAVYRVDIQYAIGGQEGRMGIDLQM